MTLIAGIRGVGKSYIAADSRATVIYPGGRQEINDSAKKWINHGRYSLAAVAGDAHLGAFITQKIVNKIGVDPSYNEVKNVFDNELKDFATEFTRKTGRYTNCAIMLAGYNPDERDEFEAVRIGEVMAAGVKGRGEGVTVNQNIDREIIKAMHYAMTTSQIIGTPMNKGRLVSVDRPRSELTGYKIIIRGDGVKIDVQSAANFEALFYGADSEYNRIVLPAEIISEIYFRDTTGHTSESIIKADTMQLYVFFQQVIAERKYKNVGGGIFPVLITPDGGNLYAGRISRYDLKKHREEVVRDSCVINDKLAYKNKTGQIVTYQSLLDIAAGMKPQYRIEL